MSYDAVWWRIAWRNLGRNRGRTLITASGLAFGYLAAVLMVGLMDGMVAELIANGTRLLTGQIQVHASDYLPERNMHRTIGGYAGTDLELMLAQIEGHPDISRASPRLYGGGLISSGDQTLAGLLLGVDPERELGVTTLLANLSAGRVPTAGSYEVLLGSEMARQLEVGIGDEIVVVAPAVDGSMGNDLYTLVGTFTSGTPAIDAAYAVLPISDLQFLMAMDPTRIHEIAMSVTRPWDATPIGASVAASLGASPGVRVQSWKQLRPDLAESLALMDSANFIIVIIIFGMAVFGVANTMLIGTFERVREFAVVRALGTTPFSVSRTVIYEGIMLGAISLVAGAAITVPVMMWFHNSPPDLSRFVGGFEWSGAMWRPILRVEYSVATPVISAVALFTTAVVAAIYPAWKVTRIPSADALTDR